jgi:rieske iron-sulfur protein
MGDTGEDAEGGLPRVPEDGTTRRVFLAAVSVLGLETVADAARPALAEAASDRPKEGDLLVAVDADQPVPLEAKDIALNAKPIRAWPMDPDGKVVRNGSRLNRVVVLRLDPATLTGDTVQRAAEGVVAYSAICPHAGCEVSGWSQERALLECSCHYSHYDPSAGAAVIDGPTQRPLAALPLKIVDGKLVVAKPFTGRVGIVPT